MQVDEQKLKQLLNDKINIKLISLEYREEAYTNLFNVRCIHKENITIIDKIRRKFNIKLLNVKLRYNIKFDNNLDIVNITCYLETNKIFSYMCSSKEWWKKLSSISIEERIVEAINIFWGTKFEGIYAPWQNLNFIINSNNNIQKYYID